MSFFISDAMAAEGATAGARSGGMSFFLMLAALLAVMYFTTIRPQQKQNKIRTALMSSIVKGDEVLTQGGLVGRVVKISDDGYLKLELNKDNHIIIKRSFIVDKLPQGTMGSL